MSWLYRYEAKGIQSYILASDRLRHIKGGSSLIESLSEFLEQALEEQAKQFSQKGKIWTQAAGGATVEFADEKQVKDFMAHWPMLVETHAPGLQLIQAYVANDQNWYDNLQKKLQEERNRLFAILPEVGPLVLRVPRSGLPALALSQNMKISIRQGKEDQNKHDAASFARALASQEPKKSKTSDKLLKKLQGNDKDRFPFVFTTENNEISKKEKSYLAIIHIDGNDMGHFFMNALDKAGIEDFSKLSEMVTEATLESARQAFAEIAQKLQLTPSKDQFPGRPIVIGGDDFTGIIRADLAFQFVKTYLTTFERFTEQKLQELAKNIKDLRKEKLPKNLTASAGISFVQTSYPFHLGLEMAETLCSFGKKSLRKKALVSSLAENDNEVHQTPSNLSFYRITSGFNESFFDLLSEGRELRVKQRNSSSPKRILTTAPYLLHKLEGFLSFDDIEKLGESARKISRSPLRQSLSFLKEGLEEKAQDRLKRLAQIMKERGKPQRDIWKQFTKDWTNFIAPVEDDKITFFTTKGGDNNDVEGTPLYDMLTYLRITEPDQPQQHTEKSEVER